jgi:spermidine synthase
MLPITLTDVHMYLMGCKCSQELLTSGEAVIEVLKDTITRSGLEFLRSQHNDFDKGGTTAVALLAESHIAIHTWPEMDSMVVVDISVCNYSADNRQKTLHLRDMVINAFRPSRKVVHEADPTPRVIEYHSPGLAYFAEIDEYIEKKRTQFQEMILFKNRSLGKVLVLDDLFQTSEKDEFFYHEAIVHPPMLTHHDPRSVLILGGGDLGAAEEVLKYPCVERVLQIDIDREVVELCKKHLKSIHKDCYLDKRFEITYEDGFEFMEREGIEKFDVLIMDLTDPVGVCERLYTEEFYRNIFKNRMNQGGIIAMHLGFPFTIPDRSKRIHGALRQVFSDVKSYSNFVPLYGDPLLYAICGDRIHLLLPEETDRKIAQYGLKDLNYICGDSLQGLFGLPVYIKKLLEVG